MITIVFLTLTIASFTGVYFARRIKGYADFYYIPQKNRKGVDVPLKPVRYGLFILGFVFLYGFTMSVVYPAYQAFIS